MIKMMILIAIKLTFNKIKNDLHGFGIGLWTRTIWCVRMNRLKSTYRYNS